MLIKVSALDVVGGKLAFTFLPDIVEKWRPYDLGMPRQIALYCMLCYWYVFHCIVLCACVRGTARKSISCLVLFCPVCMH